MSRFRITITDIDQEERERRYLESCSERHRQEKADWASRQDWKLLVDQLQNGAISAPPRPPLKERIRLLIQDRYNHASLNDKPEVAAAMKELLERMERV